MRPTGIPTNKSGGLTSAWLSLLRPLWAGGGAAAVAWAQRLAVASGELGELAWETEGEVLGLGKGLERFSQAASGVTRQAAGVVEAVRGSGEMARAGDLFSSAAGRLAACHAEIEAGLQRLATITSRLEGLLRFQRPLGHLTRTVRMLRVATRMETVRLEGERNDLGMLADEIDRFSQRLDTQVAEFFEQAEAVAHETARLAGSLEADRRHYKARLEAAGEATGAALEEIRNLLRRTGALSAQCEERTRQVVGEVSDIVSSLQFHDITRQQLEHVQKALGEAVSLLRSRAGRRDRDRLGRLLALQIAQLLQVKVEINTSARRATESLRGIAGGCQGQADDLAPLVGQEAGRQGLGRLEEQMAGLVEVLEEGACLSRRMLETTRAATGLLDRMGGSLSAIQSISEELSLLALNALVKVSRQVEGGRALGEVAEEVNRLSKEPKATVLEAAGVVAALLEESRELSARHEEALAGTEQEAQALTQAAGAALEGLRTLSHQASGQVSRLAAEAEGLVSEISAVVRGVHFDAVVAERVEAAVALIEECGRALGAEAAGSLEAAHLEHLEAHYTMESERRVHRAALTSGAANMPVAQPAAGEGLGDNVELF